MSLSHDFLKLKNGKTSAFDDIYYATKDAVFFTIYNILHDYDLSADIMQDTYIKLYQNIEKYNDDNPLAFLIQIAKNLSINEYNRRKKEVISEDIEIEDNKINQEQAQFELINDLKKILSDEELEITCLHVFYNIKHKDIAEIVKKPLGTVLWIYNNAKEKLKSNWRK